MSDTWRQYAAARKRKNECVSPSIEQWLKLNYPIQFVSDLVWSGPGSKSGSEPQSRDEDPTFFPWIRIPLS